MLFVPYDQVPLCVPGDTVLKPSPVLIRTTQVLSKLLINYLIIFSVQISPYF
jgi:hypothetical protein